MNKNTSLSPNAFKALSPEEQTLVGNVLSLLNQLQNSGSAQTAEQPGTSNMQDQGDNLMQASPEETAPEASEEGGDDEEKKSMNVMKTIINTTSDAGEARAKVEDRIDDVLTETDEDNIEEVAKAVVDILNGRNVKKSVSNPLIPLVGEMAKVMKAQQEQINEINVAFKGLLDGLGVTEQLNIAQKSADVRKSAPVLSSDNEKTLQFISQLVNKGNGSNFAQSEAGQSQADVVLKNLGNRSMLTGMLS